MVKAIEVRGLRHEYPDGSVALDGIDLDVEEGECIALLGPNGAGKSTLLLHLCGLLEPSSGSVDVLGRRLDDSSKSDIRKRLNIVFQDPDSQLFSPTVFDDIAFGPINQGLPGAEVRSRVSEALGQVGMQGFEERSPHHLSFGEKKRISIATVLSMRPEVMVLDEPTLGLDPWARKDFVELLRRLKEGRTIIIATHDLGLLDLCDKAYMMRDGRLERLSGRNHQESL